MRRSSLVFILTPLLLAASARDGAAQATTVERMRGRGERGKYDIAWVRLADAAARGRVNAELEREARDHVCDPEPDPARRRYLDAWYEMRVTYLGPRLLGLSTSMFITCGGASPARGPGSLLYDLRTGKRIELEAEMADPAAFRRFVARRALAAAPKDAGECAELYTLDELTKTRYLYVPGKRGLTATQDYPPVIMACAHDTEIPYADVVRLARPGSPLRTLEER